MFFNRQKSRACPALEVELLGLLAVVTDFVATHDGVKTEIAHLELRAPDQRGLPSVYLTPRNPAAGPSERLRAELGELSPPWLAAIAGYDSPEQRPCQNYVLPTVGMWVPLGSFLQINQGTNRLLVEAVVSGAKNRAVRSFADLYAGSGNFTLPLLSEGIPGVAVEWDPAAAAATRRTIQNYGYPGTSLQSDAVAWAKERARPEQVFDLVVLDPPRAGVGPGLAALANRASRYCAMSSCNPRSFARDLVRLLSLGFELSSLTAFDMFPHTEHVEVLAWLARRGASP